MNLSQPLVLASSSTSQSVGGLLGLIVVVVLATVVSRIARDKGRSQLGWFVVGCVIPLLSLLVVSLLSAKNTVRSSGG